MSRQLSLDLPVQTASAREDLVITPTNLQAVTFLDAWPSWPTPIVVLAGPTGAGKTHLCEIWAERSGARFVKPSQQSDEETPNDRHVVVEGLQQGAFSEAWLFHLINGMRATGNTLLLTSRRWPGNWGIALPDLQSRLKTAHLIELYEPDDDLLRGVLVKLFADRQLTVGATVIDYLVVRMERSLACAQQLVEAIDKLSLAEHRGVSRQLAGQALADLGLIEPLS